MTADTNLWDFFNFMWGSIEGWVYLPTKASNGDWQKTMYQWPKHKKWVIGHVQKSVAAGKDVYFAPSIFKTKDPKKENILGSWVLWADFDGTAPNDWPAETAVSLKKDQPPTVPVPSLRIQSSDPKKQHVYWRLEDFETSVSFIDDKNRGLAYLLDADIGGWDAGQVLRPPGTINFKYDVPIPVRIIEEREDSYARNKFDFLKPAREIVKQQLELGKTVPIEDILAKYTWSDEDYRFFIQDTPKDISGGTVDRSKSLMLIGYFGAEKGMTDTEIFSLLIHADDRWGKFKNRTDRIKRLSDIINVARQKHPHALTDLTFEGLHDGNTEVETETRYVYGFMDFVNADFKMEWIVNGLFTAQSVGIIASGPGVGKTQVLLQFGINFALGRKFLGYEPIRQLRSGIFSLEMGGPAFQLFTNNAVQAFSETERRILQDNLFVAPLGEPVNLSKVGAGQQFFEKFISENELDIVFIDSFGKIISDEIEKDVPVRALFNYLHRVKKKYNCVIFMVHHNRKASAGNKKPVEISDIYGSQYIGSESDIAVTLWRDMVNGPIEWREVKNRFSPEREPFLIERQNNLTFKYLCDLSDKSVIPDRRRSDRVNESVSDNDDFLGLG